MPSHVQVVSNFADCHERVVGTIVSVLLEYAGYALLRTKCPGTDIITVITGGTSGRRYHLLPCPVGRLALVLRDARILSEPHAGTAQLLNRLADESDRGVLVTADWLRSAKLSVLPRIGPSEALATPTRRGFRFASFLAGRT
jgi:hypothetical protein